MRCSAPGTVVCGLGRCYCQALRKGACEEAHGDRHGTRVEACDNKVPMADHPFLVQSSSAWRAHGELCRPSQPAHPVFTYVGRTTGQDSTGKHGMVLLSKDVAWHSVGVASGARRDQQAYRASASAFPHQTDAGTSLSRSPRQTAYHARSWRESAIGECRATAVARCSRSGSAADIRKRSSSGCSIGCAKDNTIALAIKQ